MLISNVQRNIERDVTGLMQNVQYKQEHDPFLIDLYAQKLVYDLLEVSGASPVILQQCHSPMDQAKSWIDNHLYETFGVHDIADALHMSASNFSHAFKKHVHMTPQAYIRTQKLKESRELLKDLSVTDVSFTLGYENPSYFIQLFKREFGVTPKQYQLQRH